MREAQACFRSNCGFSERLGRATLASLMSDVGLLVRRLVLFRQGNPQVVDFDSFRSSLGHLGRAG